MSRVYVYHIPVPDYPLDTLQGRIQDFKLGGAHLKKLGRAEGGAKMFGVFRVKNHDFTQKNIIFSDCGGRREHFWGISCEKSRFYDKKIIFFPILGGRAPGAPPPHPWPAPALGTLGTVSRVYVYHISSTPPLPPKIHKAYVIQGRLYNVN